MAVERRLERELRAELSRISTELFTGDGPDNAYAASVAAQQAVQGERVRDVLSRALQDSADLGVSVAVRQFENVGFGFDYTLANVAAREWALRHTDTLLRQLGTTTQSIVGQAVGRWVNNGEPLQRLVNDLQPAFGKQRARLIAATEVTRAYAEGTKETYRASGVVKKLVWQTANDERRCVFCGGLQGKVVGIEQSFDEALPANLRERSRPFTAPPAHPGCRCWVTGQIDEPKRQRKPKEQPVAPAPAPTPAPQPTPVTIDADAATLKQARLTKEKITQLFDIGPAVRAEVVVKNLGSQIEINGKWIEQATGEEVGEAIRTLFPNEKKAHLDVLAFSPQYTGTGAGIKVARGWFDALADADYERAELYASLSVGRYAWAKEGAQYLNPNRAAESTMLFRQWAEKRGITDLADNEYPTFNNALDVATWQHPRGRTLTGKDITNTGVPADMVLPMGKAFMLDGIPQGHGSWDAVIDLKERRNRSAAKSATVATTKAPGGPLIYVNSREDGFPDALFWSAYLVDDDSGVAPVLGVNNG